MGPNAVARLDITAAAGGLSGDVVVTRVTQVSNDVIVGGYTVVSTPF